MLPHQERVVAEKTELDDKIKKLGLFVEGETYKTLDGNERYRLTHQLATMREYSRILGERIEAFG